MITSLADRAETAVVWMGGTTELVLLLTAVALVVLVLAAVLSALADRDTSGGGKLLWVALVLWFPVLGAIAWFVVGRRGHLNRFLGIDRGRARHTVPVSVGQHSDALPQRSNGLRHA
ncbi:PLD nuclease N-terminal domain-containing protein [Nocardiopsis quinghaiensis]|uniref:PLD nuclease N-terminal domain-containing protein n=1 Tax=Nocardiopsis quinghaiensis TaxID=464995 RepID=UPI00123A4CAB|nr:PLD nuclease N-terminal domain-containing protein [Nocardiopsis quinghaiensis]